MGECMGFLKNKFGFIIFISLVTLVILVVGAFSLYQDNSSVFSSNGYILETSTKTKQKYYFSANTKYKENVDSHHKALGSFESGKACEKIAEYILEKFQLSK